MQITPLPQPSVCHFCMCMPQSVCPQTVAMKKCCIQAHSWPLGEHVQVGRRSNGKPKSTEDSGSERRTWGGREEGFESRSTKSESGLSAGLGEWLTGVWIRHSRGNGWNLSHGWKCVYLTGVCVDEPTHSLSQKSHMHKHTSMQTHAQSLSLWWSFWNVKIVQGHYANDIFPVRQILIVAFIQNQNN